MPVFYYMFSLRYLLLLDMLCLMNERRPIVLASYVLGFEL